MWHLQMSVDTVLKNVRKARADRLQGVISLHWRTEEVRASLDAFALAANDPDHIPSVEKFYADYCRREYGKVAEKELSSLLAKMDCEGWLSGVSSPEFHPYDLCTWGMLGDEQRERIRAALATVEKVCPKSNRELFETYARRVRSRGELGILSSLNQRLWLQYRELNRFFDDVTALEASDKE